MGLDLLPPVFVVGTGRCGSTMLSAMLRQHPQLVSLSEFFSLVTDLGGRIAASFPDDPVDGPAFWRIVAAVPPKAATMMRHGAAMDEVLYRPTATSRFSAEGGVPALLQTTLPHLTDDADALYGEVEAYVAGLPAAPVAEQYRRLFGWLAVRFDRRGWVERSGGSLRVVARLSRAFPDARFVHLVRDGRDCAMSMGCHLGFRMAFLSMQLTEILGVDPYESPDRSGEGDLPDDLVKYLPEWFDGDAFRREETPLPLCGHYWSGECIAGVRELGSIASDRVLTLRYEDVLSKPEDELGRLARFLDLADADWVRRAAATVRAPRSAWTALPPRVLRELTDACRPGFAALGDLYAGEGA